MNVAYPLRKFTSPLLPRVILHRKALITRLQEAIARQSQKDGTIAYYKVVMLCAPAGFGKTTLLVDFARSTSLRCCWYFLDSTDIDYAVFLNNLLISLRSVFPSFGNSLTALFTNLVTKSTLSVTSIYQQAIDALCASVELEIDEHFAMHLGNYEEINENETMNALLTYLLKKLPSQVTLIIESRIMPDISFVPLFIRSEIFALNSDALRFSPQEISELAMLQGLATFTAANAEQLAASCNGWIAGILLSTYLGDVIFFSAPDGSENQPMFQAHEKSVSAQKRKNLFAYVVSEVFRHNVAAYTFLQAASIFQQMEPAICNALLNITNADEYLDYLEQQSLFVTSHRNDEQTIYICHPLIRDLLISDFCEKEPERFIILQRQATQLWYLHHNYDQAMYHAIAANAHDLEEQIILIAYKRLLQQGYLHTVTRWLELLPHAMLESHPRLQLIQATIALTHGLRDEALQILDKAATLMSLPSAENDSTEMQILQAETNILRSKALFQVGDYSQAQALCQQALARLSNNQIELRAAGQMRLGICANLQGDFTSGLIHLQRAYHIWKNQPPVHQAVDIHGALANTYFMIGNFALAEYHLIHAFDYCEQLHDEQSKIDNLIRKGLLRLNQGLYTEAETALLQALALARTSLHDQRGEAYALANLGSLYLEQEMYTQALAFCEDGLVLAQQYGNRSLINITLSNIATIYLLMGDITSALLFTEKVEVQITSEQTVGYEQAEYELTCGLILLYQRRYDEAYACLTKIEAALSATSLKRAQLKAKLRLASCQLARDQQLEALKLLSEVTFLLISHESYKQLAQIELKWLPTLLYVVKSLPQLADLREILGLAGDERQVQEPKISANLPLLQTTPRKLTIRAFGEPTVLLNDQPIKRWRMARAMELFFFLLDANAPVSKERIITALWQEFDDHINQTFHSTLHQLRKLLGEACFVFNPHGYSLDLAACYGEHVWYDVHEFHVCHSEAEQALAREDTVAAKKAFRSMVELYQGDYGRQFSNDWCIFRRDELCTTYLEAQRQLAQLAWNEQEYNESIRHWRHILVIDNCQEEAHYNIMRCYLRQSKRSAALRQYQTCKKILQEELGIEPGSAIENLHLSLRAKATLIASM
ncbi:tetratricopeptide repeat protein [Ktedonobacteria bacterium brp13]|nr:tetratricopeptide repeat protein [Ktedonobacteria bacterium brp13]